MPKMSFKQFQRQLKEAEYIEFELPDPKNKICWYLSQPTPREIRYQIDVSNFSGMSRVPAPIRKYVMALRRWFSTRLKTKETFLPAILEMAKCPNRASWTKYSGIALRGVVRTADQLKEVEMTGKIVKPDGVLECFVAKGTYESVFEAQSWTTKFLIANDFANINANANNCPVVYEAKLKPNETFFNPDDLQKTIGTPKGMVPIFETIRIGNNPISVNMYLPVKWFQDWLVTPSNFPKGIKDRRKALEVAFGKSNANALAKSPVIAALLSK